MKFDDFEKPNMWNGKRNSIFHFWHFDKSYKQAKNLIYRIFGINNSIFISGKTSSNSPFHKI